MQTYLTFFKAHERLILVLALIVFGAFCTLKAYDAFLKHDQTQAQIAHDKAVIAAQQADESQKTAENVLLALGQLQTQINQQSARIDQQMAQRATQTVAQKKIDDSASATDLAARTQQLIGAGKVSVSTPLGDGLTFDLQAAHANADLLEDGTQAMADRADLKTELAGCQAVGAKQQDAIAALNTTVASKNIALTTEQQSHAKDVKELKDANRKSWLNGFKWGAIAGFVGGLFVPKVHTP